jgi:predicted ferric reductase
MFIIVILSFIPVIIWAFMEPLGLRFFDLNTTTTSLGQIFGLVGMVLFSINLILAGRFKFIDRYFKGLDKAYHNHHKIGAIAFSLLLFHPLFLVVKYITISIREAGLFFVPFINMPVTWGIISLLIMIVLICLTFYIKLKYHKWKLSHKFMTLAFFFAVLHTLFITSDISRNDFLKYYILILAGLGLFAIARKVFYEQSAKDRLKYRVKNVCPLNSDIVEIEMEPLGEKIIFNSGQFAFFSFQSDKVTSEYHPFSFSSSNQEHNIKIIIKNFGDYTNELQNLKEGDGVLIDGPYGGFNYKRTKNKNQIWIAGGIGITPFLSMSKVLESDYKVDLYYSVKENQEAVRVNDLQNVSQKNINFKYQLWISKDKGYLTGDKVKGLSNGLESKDIFLCGPPVFMESLRNQFVSMGVDIKKIYYENFSF